MNTQEMLKGGEGKKVKKGEKKGVRVECGKKMKEIKASPKNLLNQTKKKKKNGTKEKNSMKKKWEGWH